MATEYTGDVVPLAEEPAKAKEYSGEVIPLQEPPHPHEEQMHLTSGGSKEKAPSLWDKIRGVGEAGLSTVTGALGSAVAPPLAMAANVVGGIADPEWYKEQQKRAQEANKVDEEGYTTQDVTAGDIAKSLTYEPRTKKGQEYTQAVGEAVQPVLNEVGKLPFGAPETGVAATMAKPAVQQAGRAISKAVEPEVQALGNAASKVKQAVPEVTPVLSPEKAKLAQKALDMGIKIPPHMLSDNDFVKMAGQFVDELPLSGSTKVKNKEAFNKFLIKQIGGDESAKALTPAVFAKAQRKAGETIGQTFSKIAIPENDPTLINDLAEINKAQARQLPEVEKVINGYTKELSDLAAKNNGVIPGPLLKKLHSEIAATLRGDVKIQGMRDQLSNFQEILEDAADRQIKTPEEKAAYQDARVKYAKGKLLVPMVAKSDVTGVSPADLLGRMTATAEGKNRMAMGAAGELGDAAAIAQNFIKEEPVSHAAGRGFVLGAATSMASLGKAGLGLTAGNIYNRFGPVISRHIVEKSLPKDELPIAEQTKHGLELAEESPFKAKEKPQPEVQSRGLLSTETPAQTQQRIGVVSGRDDKGNLIDFPLRQEVLQKPEFQTVIDAYRAEAARLEQKVQNAINPAVRKKARQDLDALQKDFAAGMKEFGVQSAQDATGLRRPLYESGRGTQLPIQKTYTPADIPK